jgi:beta-lactamase regulating signal transducer with metallopeptidase domain
MTLPREVVGQLASLRAGAMTPVFGLLIDTALKGSLLIAAAAIVAYLLRERSASARHAAWSAAVIGHVALPVLTLLAPQWRLPVLPAPPWLDAATVTPTSPATVSSIAAPTARPAVRKSEAPSRGAEPQRTAPGVASPPVAAAPSGSVDVRTAEHASWPIISILGTLWIIGGLLVLARLAFGTWRVGRLARQGGRVDDGEWLSLTQRIANRLGISRPLTLLRGESLAVPVTWGVVYPAVLLPPDADEWPESRRRFVLVHEMAHVKRFDALTQLVAQLAIALLWFDPLIWLAAHRMRVEREHACDDYVLRDGTAPSLYAGELLEMVQSIGSPRHESAAPAFAALAMARRSEFEGRMLAILDPKQERHTLGRRSTIGASLALAVLVVPLAALRPFHNGGQSATAANAGASLASANPAATPATYVRQIGDMACDSAWRSGKRSTSSHVHADESEQYSFVEYLTIDANRCTQAAIIGKVGFADDTLVSLGRDAFASFRQVTAAGERGVVITPDGVGLHYAASVNGKPAPFDSFMRSWLGRVMPEVLRDASIDVPERVARDMQRGGVAAVLEDIRGIRSTAAKRTHYEALLKTGKLAPADYDPIARQAGRELATSPSDLDAVLSLVSGSLTAGSRSIAKASGNLVAAQRTMANALGAALKKSSSSADSAAMYKQYADVDDPEMILMALRGAREISSDTDKRVLLESIAPKVLGKTNPRLRTAFFEAAATIDSDTDLRVLLQDALDYAQNDQSITLAVFSLVGSRMTSDTDRRITLTRAAEKHLLTNAVIREAYAATAKKMTSSTDYVITMQAALKQ